MAAGLWNWLNISEASHISSTLHAHPIVGRSRHGHFPQGRRRQPAGRVRQEPVGRLAHPGWMQQGCGVVELAELWNLYQQAAVLQVLREREAAQQTNYDARRLLRRSVDRRIKTAPAQASTLSSQHSSATSTCLATPATPVAAADATNTHHGANKAPRPNIALACTHAGASSWLILISRMACGKRTTSESPSPFRSRHQAAAPGPSGPPTSEVSTTSESMEMRTAGKQENRRTTGEGKG